MRTDVADRIDDTQNDVVNPFGVEVASTFESLKKTSQPGRSASLHVARRRPDHGHAAF
jgi:hypothetical protein